MDLKSKNFSQNFYAKVAVLAKGGVNRLVSQAAQPVIEIATHEAYITALAGLCSTKKNDAELDLEIKRNLREIPLEAQAGNEVPVADKREGVKRCTDPFPSESLDLVVKKVREKSFKVGLRPQEMQT